VRMGRTGRMGRMVGWVGWVGWVGCMSFVSVVLWSSVCSSFAGDVIRKCVYHGPDGLVTGLTVLSRAFIFITGFAIKSLSCVGAKVSFFLQSRDTSSTPYATLTQAFFSKLVTVQKKLHCDEFRHVAVRHATWQSFFATWHFTPFARHASKVCHS
jgi:hypothetical protein